MQAGDERLDAIFPGALERAPVPVWVAGRDGLRTFFNATWLEFTGRTLEQELGEGWTDGLHPDDRVRCRAELTAAFAHCQPFDVEYRLRRADGEYRWLVDRGVPRYAPDGGLEGYTGSCFDVTDERASRAELRRREAQQAAVADLGRLALEGGDVATLLDTAVDAVTRALGVESAAVLERVGDDVTILRACSGGPAELVGTARPGTGPGSPVGETLARRQPIVVDDWRAETRFSQGVIVRGLRLASSAYAVIRGVPEPYGVLAAYSAASHSFDPDDVLFLRGIANVLGTAIARSAAEEALLGRECQARLAMDVGRMGSWRWNPATGEVAWSPELEAIFGLAPGAFDGRFETFLSLVHPDDREATMKAIEAARATGADIDFEHRAVDPSGAVKWIQGRGRRVLDASGAPLQWVGVGIDITEAKTALDEREQLLAREQAASAAARATSRELAETVARLDALLEHAPVAFGFYDLGFRFVRLNHSLAEINGLPVDAHLGRTVEEVLPDLWPHIAPHLEQVRETAQPVVDREISGVTPAHPGVERHWLASYYPVTGASGELLGIGVVVVEITDRQRGERGARLVAAASELIAAAPDLETVLARAARLPLGEFADSCQVYLLAVNSERRRVGIAHVDPSVEAGLAEGDRHRPLDVERHEVLAKVLAGARPVLFADVPMDAQLDLAHDADEAELMELHGIVSAIAVPLVVRGTTIGLAILSYTRVSGRRYVEEDLRSAAELGWRIGLAIENARLARAAERASGRLELLARASELLTVRLDAGARLDALSRLVLPKFADACAVYLVENGQGVRLVSFAHGDPDREAAADIAGWPTGTVSASTPVGEAIRENRPVLVPDVDPKVLDSLALDEDHAAVVDAMGIRSLLVVPLPGPGGPIGAVGFGFGDSGRRYSVDDIAIAEELARRSAPAVEHALRFEQEQATAEALQRSLLPDRLPVLGDLRLAARYLPGTLGLKVGGDWYDALVLPDGRVVLAIGDVVGHGVRAAAAMGRLRHALQFCALDQAEPAEIMARLNRHFCSLPDAEMATLLVVVLDTDRSRVTYASAGHPPLFLRGADGRVARLDEGRGMPLCASPTARYHSADVEVPDGSVLLLYTDGLVERRGESLDVGFARLADALGRGPAELDDLADDVIERMLGAHGRDDDVALLAVAFDTGATDRLDLRLAAEPRELSRLRHALRDWLARAGVGPAVQEEIAVAVNEVAANAVEHAYGLGDASFAVAAQLRPDRVTVVVEDRGRWRRERGHENRGRGLDLARALVDDVEVHTGDQGTTVRLERLLPAAGGRGVARG